MRFSQQEFVEIRVYLSREWLDRISNDRIDTYLGELPFEYKVF